ncbi:MAG: translation elongation factor 4 [Patescibacteria group bacterium]
MQNIRNFCIIAHIDHGKSTLADRMLELTGTVEKRKMREQFLDKMDLERERGITIKMQPVRMKYSDYILNLIDTPGHIDFQYEVSRALLAVEGAILLVDATKGVQAQTLANLELARKHNLTVIPVVNKIDIADAKVEESAKELMELLNIEKKEILFVSGKTGEGVPQLLKTIVEKIPPPKSSGDKLQALIFDSFYSLHKGVIAHVRIFGGHISSNETTFLFHKKIEFKPLEVGIFSPEMSKTGFISSGEIGYIATNLKDPSLVRVGDTIGQESLPGYFEPQPVVWASIFPQSTDEFENLKSAFSKLRINDASLSFEVEGSKLFGRALRAGFLGMLHLDISVERIIREFGIEVIVAQPSVEYELIFTDGSTEKIKNAEMFSQSEKKVKEILEPWFSVFVLARSSDLSKVLDLIQKNKGEVLETKTISEDRLLLVSALPLRKIVTNFFDDLKSATQGYASMSYEFKENKPADIVKLNVFVAEDEIPQFAKLITKDEAEFESHRIVDRLYEILPRQLFALKIQAGLNGRILASRTLSAVGKNVTAKLYGGDRTRKMKLWKKQKEGKKRLQESAKVEIPHSVYLKIIKRD